MKKIADKIANDAELMKLKKDIMNCMDTAFHFILNVFVGWMIIGNI